MAVGVYRRLPPTAYKAPWVRIKCHTRVAKLDAMRDATMIMRPVTEHARRIEGHVSRIYSETGAKKYITPVEQVPTMAMPLGDSSKGG